VKNQQTTVGTQQKLDKIGQLESSWMNCWHMT